MHNSNHVFESNDLRFISMHEVMLDALGNKRTSTPGSVSRYQIQAVVGGGDDIMYLKLLSPVPSTNNEPV